MKRILLTFSISFLIFPFTGAAQGEQRYASGTATDQENNSFEWINYGTQDWTIENAKVETYRDGTEIPQVTDASVWANLTTGAWCYYDNDPTKGKLYNWYAVAGIHDSDPNTPNKEFAPEGWHVPTYAEWTTLEEYLIANGYNYDGTVTGNKIAKAMASTTGWDSLTYTGAVGNDLSLNNSSGFNGSPEGRREGSFYSKGDYALFWSSTESSFYTDHAWILGFYKSSYGLNANENDNISSKWGGSSVRLVRDTSSIGAYGILLNGTVSTENNQIKNVADPTDAQDAATKSYVDSNISNTNGSPWYVNQAQDSIAFEKKVVIGNAASENVPPLSVIGTDSGPQSPTLSLIRSAERNNVIQFETSELDNDYAGSIGIIETFDFNNNNFPNFFAIGINNGQVWKNPLRIYYDNASIKLGMHTSNTYSDGNLGGANSISLGYDATAEGDFSSALGTGVKAYSNLEVALGSYNTAYTAAGGADTFNSDDRILVIGNGTDDLNRSDALVIKKSGELSVEGNAIKNVADPVDGKDAVTKDYLLEKIAQLQDQIDALQASSGSGTVNDQDGNSYPYLTYGDQVWTVKNAEMVTYRDGTVIPQVTDATEWSNLTTGAWCYYGNDSSKGKLYNWYAVAGIHDTDPNTPNKELAPEGWHVPTDAEWTTLEEYLIANGYNYDGTTSANKIAKAMASTTGWNSSGDAGAPGNDQSLNNSSGFNAFPEGFRLPDGLFLNERNRAFFWSSTEDDVINAWNRNLDNTSYLGRYFNSKQDGFSVRFVRD